ncbi:winged helix-turn-helix transcriptional regulator [Candidatus Bathyarchaeota archaeon]|jgi:DNA-binding transcriptional ArsR family regulator|nr:winged helix-turn-helix transcriptional regulator [Candidatus Bathyarchaeota archaeon]MCK4399435.1 winged helix-turn-helix transcriptional regulator [Candidatus Bathyarchaeota archaeon]MCK4439333.1 winged helix-turn-helix transcriptional regulator [Candidatus Bathyarchaeota archaeon]
MSGSDSKTIGGSMEETKDRHRRYLRAVNNPLRRRILRAIKEGCGTMESLVARLDVDAKTLDWHIRILEDGYCVERAEEDGGTRYILTQEGLVVDYVEGP